MKTTAVRVRDAMKDVGHCLVPGHDFDVDTRISTTFRAFQAFWDNLLPDPYIDLTPNPRLRRHAQFRYNPRSDTLDILPPGPYYQSLESNPLYGGQYRQFSPFEDEALQNAFLRELLLFNIRQLYSVDVRAPIAVHAHMVRIIGYAERPGEPSPEGIHRDGFEFVSIHLMNRVNVVGGVSSVIDPGLQSLLTVTLETPLDSLYVNDRLFLHVTTEIRPVGDGIATRDVLLLSYDSTEA